MDKELGIGVTVVVITVAVFVVVGVEVALLPDGPLGPPPPTSLPIPSGTFFALTTHTAYEYWAGVPFQVNAGSGSHLYHITGQWRSEGRSGVLASLDNSPIASYPGTPECIVPIGQPCDQLPDPFTYDGSLDVYLYTNNGSVPAWATPTFLPIGSYSGPPVPENLTVTYYVVFAAPKPDIITVTGAFMVEALPAPTVSP